MGMHATKPRQGCRGFVAPGTPEPETVLVERIPYTSAPRSARAVVLVMSAAAFGGVHDKRLAAPGGG